MEKFMYLFKGGIDPNESPEKMQAQMKKWADWMGALSQKGTFVAGEPLQPGGKKIEGAKKTVTDGPFVEAKEMVSGYLIVNAKDYNDAVEIAKGCPIFEAGGTVEVRAVQKMEMPR